jgi:hypothetical protein
LFAAFYFPAFSTFAAKLFAALGFVHRFFNFTPSRFAVFGHDEPPSFALMWLFQHGW